MTRRNNKRNKRRNHQRNNNSELNQFAQMLLGALLGKGAGMITEALMKKAEEKTEDKPHTGIRQSGNLLESSCIINGDGSATEIPIPDGYQIFISEDGKPMIRKKIEGDEKPTNDAEEDKPITYDDICKELFLNKKTYWLDNKKINYLNSDENNCNDLNNCTSIAQAKHVAAFIKLQNIAKYLNGYWKPDFCCSEKKWSISEKFGNFEPAFSVTENGAKVYFKSEYATDEAIRLMGKDSLNDLFSTDW